MKGTGLGSVGDTRKDNYPCLQSVSIYPDDRNKENNYILGDKSIIHAKHFDSKIGVLKNQARIMDINKFSQENWGKQSSKPCYTIFLR